MDWSWPRWSCRHRFSTVDGFPAQVIVDYAPAGFVVPHKIGQLVANLGGPVLCEGPITPTLVGSAVATLTDCAMADLRFEVVLIIRGTLAMSRY